MAASKAMWEQFLRDLERQAVQRYGDDTEPLHLHGNNVAESQAWDAEHLTPSGKLRRGD